MLILLAWWICSWFAGPAAGRWLWLAALGASLGFHFTFTLQALIRRQSDLQAYGRLFPYALIYCGNVFGLTLLTALFSGAALSEWTGQLARDFQAVWDSLAQAAGWVWQSLQTISTGGTAGAAQ